MKFILNKCLDLIVRFNFLYSISKPFIKIFSHIEFLHNKKEKLILIKNLEAFFKDRTVKFGFFKGLIYPNFTSFGSSIFPKLLGSYECELHSILNELSKNKYDNILNIGCGEGYYTIGFAKYFFYNKIHAFDISNEALDLCKKLAVHNKVEDKIQLYNNCYSTTFSEMNNGSHNFIFCDCEGYENELFTKLNLDQFKFTDLIIEVHSFFYENLKDKLFSLFKESHDVYFISSWDNNKKIYDFKNILNALSHQEKLLSVEEGRPMTMEWMVAKAKMK